MYWKVRFEWRGFYEKYRWTGLNYYFWCETFSFSSSLLIGAITAYAILAEFNKSRQSFLSRANAAPIGHTKWSQSFSTWSFQRSGGLPLPLLPPAGTASNTFKSRAFVSIRTTWPTNEALDLYSLRYVYVVVKLLQLIVPSLAIFAVANVHGMVNKGLSNNRCYLSLLRDD